MLSSLTRSGGLLFNLDPAEKYITLLLKRDGMPEDARMRYQHMLEALRHVRKESALQARTNSTINHVLIPTITLTTPEFPEATSVILPGNFGEAG